MDAVPGPKLRAGLFAAVALLSAPPAAADVHCVKAGGGDGCFAAIGDALAAAAAGDVVRVAEGTYTENVLIATNVTLEGGWDTAFATRDPAVRVTTLQPATPTESVVSIEGSMLDPASSTPTFDGFTVTGGEADLGGNHGGGLRLRDTNALVRGNVVIGNRAALFGGGVWVQRGAPRLEANRIEDNFVTGAAVGAGVSLEGSQALLVDNEITLNEFDQQADSSGSGVGIQGGGPVRIRGGRIAENVSAFYGTGVYAVNVSELEIDGVRFELNYGYPTGHGDALYLDATPARVTNTSFYEHDGSLDSISIGLGSPTTIANCTVLGSGEKTGIASASDLTLVNDIVTNWSLGAEVAPGVDVTATTNDFFGNADATLGFSLDASNLSVDPLLDASYHLTAGSPLIDAGSRTAGPFRDFDGDPRPMAVLAKRFRFDVGADEFAGAPQRVVDLAREDADLTLRGPGNPPENPDSIGPNDWIGYSVLARDVSGDGAADLLVSAQDWAEDFDTLNATGRVFGFRHFGSRRTGVLDLAVTPADFEVQSTIQNQHVGEELATGDLNDDGTPDLLIGAGQNHDDPEVVPAAFALFGGSALATDGATIEAGGLGDFAVTAPERVMLTFATENGVAAGDLSGDGIDDLAVGDLAADDGALVDTGAVFVAFGGAGFAGVLDLAAAAADFTLYGPSENNLSFGAGAYYGGLALGDLDGDGALDLAARDAARAYVLFGPLTPGAIHLTTEAADATVGGLAEGGILVMDATGDRVVDLILDSGGDVRVIAGPLGPGDALDAAADAAYTLTGADTRSLAAGDLLADLRPELVLGDPVARVVRVVPPGAHGPGEVDVDEVAPLVLTGPFAVARNLGFDVAAGDLDGDGRDDLVASAWQTEDPALDEDFRDIGKAFVVYGDACTECACPAEPLPGCIAGAKGRLAIDERKQGKEKLTFSLGKLAAASEPRDLGDPAGGSTRFDLCLYDDAGARIGALAVDRAGESCGAKPCWKALKSGFQYADPEAAASGVVKLVAKSGAAGKGKLSLKGRNQTARGQASLPTGLAAALAGGGGATAQLVASDGVCFELAATRVKRAEPARFDASAP
jgi:hypothetical protein